MLFLIAASALFIFGLGGAHLARVLFVFGLVARHLAWVLFDCGRGLVDVFVGWLTCG